MNLMNLMNLMYYYIFYYMNSLQKDNKEDKKEVIEMPMDLFIAYKLQKRIEKGLKEERERERKRNELNQMNDIDPIKIIQSQEKVCNEESLRNDCPLCGQNMMWCLCEYQ